jgi:hypothetical protein
MPIRVWPFVALAALIAYRSFDRIANDPYRAFSFLAQLLLVAVPPVVAALVGAAYFARHRDAPLRSAMALGVILLAVEQAMRFAEPWVIDAITSMAPSSADDPFGYIRQIGLYGSLTGTIGIAGLVCILAGLRAARRRPSAPGQRFYTVLIFGVSAVTIFVNAWSIFRFGRAPTDAALVLNVQGLLVDIILVVVTAAVTSEAVAGARAREQPRTAWWLAAAGLLLPLVAQIPRAFLVVAGNVFESTDVFFASSWIGAVVQAIASALWLWAFVLGLPSIEPADETQSGQANNPAT